MPRATHNLLRLGSHAGARRRPYKAAKSRGTHGYPGVLRVPRCTPGNQGVLTGTRGVSVTRGVSLRRGSSVGVRRRRGLRGAERDVPLGRAARMRRRVAERGVAERLDVLSSAHVIDSLCWDAKQPSICAANGGAARRAVLSALFGTDRKPRYCLCERLRAALEARPGGWRGGLGADRIMMVLALRSEVRSAASGRSRKERQCRPWRSEADIDVDAATGCNATERP